MQLPLVYINGYFKISLSKPTFHFPSTHLTEIGVSPISKQHAKCLEILQTRLSFSCHSLTYYQVDVCLVYSLDTFTCCECCPMMRTPVSQMLLLILKSLAIFPTCLHKIIDLSNLLNCNWSSVDYADLPRCNPGMLCPSGVKRSGPLQVSLLKS